MNKRVREILTQLSLKDSGEFKELLYELDEYKKRTKKPIKKNILKKSQKSFYN